MATSMIDLREIMELVSYGARLVTHYSKHLGWFGLLGAQSEWTPKVYHVTIFDDTGKVWEGRDVHVVTRHYPEAHLRLILETWIEEQEEAFLQSQDHEQLQMEVGV